MRARKAIVVAGVATAAALVAIDRARRRFDFRGKTVLITGARGLAYALAARFRSEGAHVAVVARDVDEIAAAEQSLPGVFGVVADLTQPGGAHAVVSAVREHFGDVDVLVNCAGLIQVGPAELMTRDDYERAMRIHFFAPLALIEAVVPSMRLNRSGRIVNVSSIGGKIAVPHLLPYTASKLALVGLSEGLHAELAPDGIAVTTVCPGLMRTGSTRHARFKGDHAAEHAWFSALAAMPGISIPATRAAARIVQAARYGKAEVMLSVPARIASTMHGLLPGTTTNVNAWIARMLPDDGGAGLEEKRGDESGPAPDEKQAREFNEIRVH